MGHLPNFTALELPKGPRSAAVAKSAKSRGGWGRGGWIWYLSTLSYLHVLQYVNTEIPM